MSAYSDGSLRTLSPIQGLIYSAQQNMVQGSAIPGEAEALLFVTNPLLALQARLCGWQTSSCQLRQELQCPSQLTGHLSGPQHQNQGLLLAAKPTLLVSKVVVWTERRSQESS